MRRGEARRDGEVTGAAGDGQFAWCRRLGETRGCGVVRVKLAREVP